MADIKLHREHQLGLEGARAAADQMVAKLKERFGVTGRWDGNDLHFDRSGVSGVLHIAAKAVDLEVTLGFLLKAMRGPIEGAIHEQLDSLLAKRPAAAVKEDAKENAKATAKENAKPTPGKKAPGGRKKSG